MADRARGEFKIIALKIELLEQSFAAVAPKGNELVNVFYRNLFADFPQVRPLFENIAMAEAEEESCWRRWCLS